MRLIQTYTFLMKAKPPFSEWPEIVHRFLQEQGLSCGKFYYYFEELPYPGNPLKSCPRAVKDCPALGEPEFVEASAYGVIDTWMLSNIHTPTACTEEDLLPLMKRIHRSYGFTQTTLYYLDVDFFGIHVPAQRDLTSAQRQAERFQLPTEPRVFLDRQMQGCGFTLHRDILSNNTLSMSMDIFHDGKLLDPTPYLQAMKTLLPGVRYRAFQEVRLSPEEDAEVHARSEAAGPLLERIGQFFESCLPGRQGQNHFLSQYKLAPTLKTLSKAYGWSYRFVADGFFTMDKKTEKGQYLRLMADSGPSRFDTSFYLEFQGVGYRHRLYTSTFLPTNQQELDDAAQQVFAAAAAFERELLPELTNHFPHCPDWFTPSM